ncbi:MAG: histidinol-phosphate transaminase [Oscillospiraceae bacterium]|nr:histidinol-phosphate transaminase [Oscillospiraceae bacterium]
MSRFFSTKYASLTPYTPGEQPRERKFVKLNTNESPFPPSPLAIAGAAKAAEALHLYSDPTCTPLTARAAEVFGVKPEQLVFTNGSDDALNFAFMAFCDADHPAVFPDITYGFYKVFARLNGVPYEEKPLMEDFSVRVEDYLNCGRTVFLANPNAPTGIALPLSDIEKIAASNPDSVVIIDEAYIDFGGESALPLIDKYDNLLVIQTFSKSRSLAGGRLGMAFGCEALIRDLNTIRYSTNPYNINSMTMAAGVGALEDGAYFRKNCQVIRENRAWTAGELNRLGFAMTDSSANFLFARHPGIPGKELYLALKERGILVRHFDTPRLTDYLRITVGSREQMEILTQTLEELL